ncbi:hypothetical protein STSP2_02074 [Anaerohalosphaera lusitana]|uniref:Tfp pilus assembly protein PilV n=1 Tax=Anaerohalosphaera lusitana TaxID=1936003 RepID=A0A1U9NM60_9BACT|nr:prepilin-type N-terminal cleavage/methylation domain-containing protein [Anaerohalosphaera lusitana]AQT68897.1 hypothetical protein STSP2_02074 [Anaerohalosphaera lusitana]
MNPSNKNRNGFTLMESMMATVVLAMVAAGVALPLSSGANVQMEGARLTMAAKLANDLMAEVAATDFDSISSTFDGLSESSGALTEYDGDLLSGPAYEGFSRSVNCSTATVGKVDMLWVTVSVSHDGEELVALKRLFGP